MQDRLDHWLQAPGKKSEAEPVVSGKEDKRVNGASVFVQHKHHRQHASM